MSDFVEQCRAEWKRLGVPESIAEEMAADLACDIREAEVDGISVEELLGSSASDPRAFAASWATERGIVQMRRGQANGRRWRLVLVAFTGVAALALIVAALLLATGEPKVALVTSRAAPPHLPGSTASFAPPPGRVQASAAAPIEWILLFLALVALAFSGWLWRWWWGRSRPPIAPAQ
jgi:hypothetical protein